MGQYNSFANLLKDQATHDSLPEVLFTDNTDLRGSTTRLAIATESSDEVSAENIVDVINEFDELSVNRYEFGSTFDSYEAIADTFANKLNEGVKTLRTIKDTVCQLKDKHDEMVAMRIAEDPILAKICGVEQKLHMDSMEWGYLDEVDERFVIAELHDKVGHNPDKEVTPSMLGLIINAMPCANRTNVVELEKVSIRQDVFNNIVDKLTNYIPNESRDFIAGMLSNLCMLDRISCEQSVKSARKFLDGVTANNMNHILHISVSYNKLFDAIKSIDMDLSESTMQELGKHVDAMRDICNTMLYIASYYRNTVWKDAVIVPGPYVNPDNYSAFESDGGTMTNLVHHCNRFYTDIDVPIKGISGQFVLKSAKRLEEEYNKEATANIAIVNGEKKRIDRGSFVRMSVEYLKGQTLSPKFFNGSDLSKYAGAVYDSMPEAPIESRLYKLIINSMYPNTITAMLYDRISKEYTDYAAKTGKLSKETCEELDEKVYADMISEYFVNQGILVV